MAVTSKVFDFDNDPNGVRVVVAREPLHGGCLSDGEIDANIRLLKEDLDAVAKRMKLAIRERATRPLLGND